MLNFFFEIGLGKVEREILYKLIILEIAKIIYEGERETIRRGEQ